MQQDVESIARPINHPTGADPGHRALITTALHWMEATHVAYLVHRWPGWTGEDPFLLATYPRAWTDRYSARALWTIDPSATDSLGSDQPIDWLAVRERDRDVADFFRDAAAHGVGPVGITFPLNGPAGYAGALTFTFDIPPEQWPAFKATRYADMNAVATICHTILVKGIARENQPAPHLSPREIQCLGWASEGKTNQDISVIPGLKEATVRMFLDSARTKLDCLNKAHLITKAFRHGLIS